MGLLDTEIRNIVGDALAGILLDLSYTPPSSGGTYTAGAWTGATPGSATGCKGLIDDDVKELVGAAGFQRKATHRRILITQTSFSGTPEAGGKVTARGETLTVLWRRQDPAQATWELLAEV